MKLGACLGYGDAEKFEFAIKCGLDFAETDFENIANAPKEEFESFCEKIRNAGIPVLSANHFLPGDLKIVGDNIDYERIDKYLETGFERASRLGIKNVVFGSGKARSFDEGYSKELARNQVVKFLKEYVSPKAVKYGVNVVVEPLSFAETTMIFTVKDGVDLAGECDFKGVFGLADLYHVYSNNDDIDGIANFKGQIKHAHIAEIKSRLYPNKNAPKDVNDVYTQFFNALKKAGCETCSIEGHTNDFTTDLPIAIEVLKEALIQ